MLWLNGSRNAIAMCIPKWKGKLFLGNILEELHYSHTNGGPLLSHFILSRYKPTMAAAGPSGPSFLDIRTPTKLPDALRGEKYAFVSLPLAEFRKGGGITSDNIGIGKICPIDKDLPSDAFVNGVVILSSRAKALATWLAGTEICSLKCDLRRRTLVIESDISTQYLMARLNDDQRTEGAIFEEGKDNLRGLHFISVQFDDDSDPEGFWVLREINTVL
jgi:hypothetical protein